MACRAGKPPRLCPIRMDLPRASQNGLVTEPSANELVGGLTLTDAMLGELVTDVRRILAHAEWPGHIRLPAVGLTTGQAAEKLERDLRDEPTLATEALTKWIADIKDAFNQRNRIVHAIALNQCMECGDATRHLHPRSGEDVDRGPEAVAAIKKRYSDLRSRGLPIATELSKAVNARIRVEARRITDETDEIQNPPQAYPQRVEHLCASCRGGERGETTAHIGPATVVIPTERWDEFQAGRWPPQDE